MKKQFLNPKYFDKDIASIAIYMQKNKTSASAMLYRQVYATIDPILYTYANSKQLSPSQVSTIRKKVSKQVCETVLSKNISTNNLYPTVSKLVKKQLIEIMADIKTVKRNKELKYVR